MEELLKNCTSMIKVSMVPQIILCTSKVMPVSDTKKKIGQVLKSSSSHYILFYFSLFLLQNAFSSLELKHKKCEVLWYANDKRKE